LPLSLIYVFDVFIGNLILSGVYNQLAFAVIFQTKMKLNLAYRCTICNDEQGAISNSNLL